MKPLSFANRAIGRVVTLLARAELGALGKGAVLNPPLRLEHAASIRIGVKVYIGSGCWLQGSSSNAGSEPTLLIGDGTSITGRCIISAESMVSIGPNVLIGPGTHISDHTHETNGEGAIKSLGSTKPKPVFIGEGSWIGQNVVVMPGVTIGRFSVVGANSIVRRDVPDHTIVAGNPAVTIRGKE